MSCSGQQDHSALHLWHKVFGPWPNTCTLERPISLWRLAICGMLDHGEVVTGESATHHEGVKWLTCGFADGTVYVDMD